MQPLPVIAETFASPPLAKDERIERVKEVLHTVGIFPRRMSHAATTGLTITYAHVQPGDGPKAAQVLAENLDWADTDVAAITGGSIAVTTHRG